MSIKSLLYVFAILVAISSNVFAGQDDYNMVKKYTTSPADGVVLVLYHTSGNVIAANANIKKLMGTRDEGAMFNPYWVPSIAAEAYDTKSGCGIIAGNWYDNNYSYRGKWEGILDRNMEKYADVYALGYNVNGELRTIVTTDGALDALVKMCKWHANDEKKAVGSGKTKKAK